MYFMIGLIVILCFMVWGWPAIVFAMLLTGEWVVFMCCCVMTKVTEHGVLVGGAIGSVRCGCG